MEKYLAEYEKRRKGESSNYEIDLVSKDGRIIPVQVVATPIIDDEEKYSGEYALIIDLTSRKKMEEALRKSEERYRRLVELSPDGILTLDLDGIVTSCNPTLLHISGYSEDEMLGKHFSRLPFLRMRDIPGFSRVFNQILGGEIHMPFDLSFERKDGTLGWGSISLSLLREDRKPIGVQADIRDITDHRRLEEREDSLRSLIIYDIRNKLLNVRDFLELMNQTELSEKQEEYMQTLRMLYDDVVELMDRAR
jgi:PAS domain S-box-containing protein